MDCQKQVLREFSEIQVNTWFFTIVKTATIKSESLSEDSEIGKAEQPIVAT